MTEGEEMNAVTIPGELYAFLMGEGEIDGTSFDDLGANLPGRFWWRALLRTASLTRTPTATPSDVEKAYREGWTDAWYSSQTDIGPIDVEQVDQEWLVSNARLALSAIEGEKK